MRRPRVQFTVRRMMVAVAIVGVSLALSLWVQQMQSRSPAFRRLARQSDLEGDPAGFARYDRAARYPWLQAEPHPPEPK